MPESGISLLPQEVEKVRKQEAREAFFRKASLLFLLISVISFLAVFVYYLNLRGQINNLEVGIERTSSEIQSLGDIESNARSISKKSQALSDILGNKIYFSTLLREIASSTPPDVGVTELVAPSESKLAISGSSRSYVSLRNFLLELKGAKAEESGLFESFNLRSVSLNKQSGEVDYDADLNLKTGILRSKE